MPNFLCTLWEALEASDRQSIDGYDVERYGRVDSIEGPVCFVLLADGTTLDFNPDKVLLIDHDGAGIVLGLLDADPEPGAEPVEHHICFRVSRPLTCQDLPPAQT